MKIDHIYRRELHAALDDKINDINNGVSETLTRFLTRRADQRCEHPDDQFVAGLLVSANERDFKAAMDAAGIDERWSGPPIQEVDPREN